MAGQTEVERLARLFVDNFEIGERKAERDVADEVCGKFGIDLASLEQRLQKKQLRSEVSRRLSQAAPSAESLVSAIARSGATFIQMVDEIYSLLSRFSATTAGPSEEFRFRLGDLDLGLTLSPAFLEFVRKLQRRLTWLELGTINDDLLSAFLGIDGDFYGSWPPRQSWSDGDEGRRALAREITYLGWLQKEIAVRSRRDPRWRMAETELQGTSREMESFLETALFLVGARVRTLQEESGPDTEEDLEERRAFQLRCERTLLRTAGVLRSGIAYTAMGSTPPEGASHWIHVHAERLLSGSQSWGAVASCIVPLRDDPVPNHYGTAVGGLASLCAIWKAGVVRPRDDAMPADLRSLLDNNNYTGFERWARGLSAVLKEAAYWLRHEVWSATGKVPRQSIVESWEQFLNLPLWRHRWLLYEIWLLCRTLQSAHDAGWECSLALEPGTRRQVATWVLPKGSAKVACGTLSRKRPASAEVEIWYQRRSVRNNVDMMPDVALLACGEPERELVVVEGKDRFRMSVSEARHGALSVGERYSKATGAPATWIVNWSTFSGGRLSSPSDNHGDAWRGLYFASDFRPGNVPEKFDQTISEALWPPTFRLFPQETAGAQAIALVVDTTGSMHKHLDSVWELFAACLQDPRLQGEFTEYYAILFGDHDPSKDEPYVVRRVGPHPTVDELIQASQGEPRTHGGDDPEALEDAIRECSNLAAELGCSLCCVIITDAPPHRREECPNRLDFSDEVEALLDSGSQCLVMRHLLSDSAARRWSPFESHERFSWLDPEVELIVESLLSRT